jgi:hypothetical protein
MADYTMQSEERNKFLSALGNINEKRNLTAAQAESQRQALMFDRTARQGGMDAYSADQMKTKVDGVLGDNSLTRNQRAMALQNTAAQYATTLAPQADAAGNQTNAKEINAFANAAGFMGAGNNPASQSAFTQTQPSAIAPSAPTPVQNEAPNLLQDDSQPSMLSGLTSPQIALTGGTSKVLEKQKPSMFDTALA